MEVVIILKSLIPLIFVGVHVYHRFFSPQILGAKRGVDNAPMWVI
jgi:hypothetical protein